MLVALATGLADIRHAMHWFTACNAARTHTVNGVTSEETQDSISSTSSLLWQRVAGKARHAAFRNALKFDIWERFALHPEKMRSDIGHGSRMHARRTTHASCVEPSRCSIRGQFICSCKSTEMSTTATSSCRPRQRCRSQIQALLFG